MCVCVRACVRACVRVCVRVCVCVCCVCFGRCGPSGLELFFSGTMWINKLFCIALRVFSVFLFFVFLFNVISGVSVSSELLSV